MSRIGKMPIAVDKSLKVNIDKHIITIEGSKGKLEYHLPWGIEAEFKDGQIIIRRKGDSGNLKAFHGLARALVNNMVEGLTKGFKKELEIVGVGYKAQLKGKKLVLNIGFSHPVEIDIPEGIKVSLPAATRIVVEGADKAFVGKFAAEIRKIYPPEPYKGKGIRYVGEVVRRKLGKAMAK